MGNELQTFYKKHRLELISHVRINAELLTKLHESKLLESSECDTIKNKMVRLFPQLIFSSIRRSYVYIYEQNNLSQLDAVSELCEILYCKHSGIDDASNSIMESLEVSGNNWAYRTLLYGVIGN